jgi:flagellar hook assembly protein FlgD
VFASTCEAGRRICTWDGKNAQGTAAGSGVYMYRVRAAGLSATGKVTLTR